MGTYIYTMIFIIFLLIRIKPLNLNEIKTISTPILQRCPVYNWINCSVKLLDKGTLISLPYPIGAKQWNGNTPLMS